MLVIGLIAGLLTVPTAPVEAAAVPLASVEAEVASVEADAAPTYVIHIVIDDLGYHDVQWRNNQTITPTLDRLVAEDLGRLLAVGFLQSNVFFIEHLLRRVLARVVPEVEARGLVDAVSEPGAEVLVVYLAFGVLVSLLHQELPWST